MAIGHGGHFAKQSLTMRLMSSKAIEVVRNNDSPGARVAAVLDLVTFLAALYHPVLGVIGMALVSNAK
jgi:hypothetical protein